jgi:hypothetical protein
MSNPDWKQYEEIRKAYLAVIDGWMDEFEKTGNMVQDPYLFDWVSIFTPIESSVWSDIRGNGLDFYPQFPVLNYFADFANPFHKIAIECDGKDFHDEAKDAKRDAVFDFGGWMVFRIPGSECNRIIDPRPLSLPKQEQDPEAIKDWLLNTSEGLVWAIARVFFDDDDYTEHPYSGYMQWTIEKHLTTSKRKLKW